MIKQPKHADGVFRVLAIDIDGIIRDLESPYACLTGDTTVTHYDHKGWTEWFRSLSQDELWNLMTFAPIFESGLLVYKKLVATNYFDLVFFLTAQGKHCVQPTIQFMKDNVFGDNMTSVSDRDNNWKHQLDNTLDRIANGFVDMVAVSGSDLKVVLLRDLVNKISELYKIQKECVVVGLIDDRLKTQLSLDSDMLQFFASKWLSDDALDASKKGVRDISPVLFGNARGQAQNSLIYSNIIRVYVDEISRRKSKN